MTKIQQTNWVYKGAIKAIRIVRVEEMKYAIRAANSKTWIGKPISSKRELKGCFH